MQYNFSNLKTKFKKVEEFLGKEYSQLNIGRASPMVLDGVSVESYGSFVLLKNVASVSIEDPKTLRVAPWDKAMIKEIEGALQAANLGVSISTDGAGVRVSFPDLTAERRALLVKLVNEKLESAKVSVRKEREECWNQVVKKEKDGEISEDDKFKFKEDLQKVVESYNQELESLALRKEQDLAQ